MQSISRKFNRFQWFRQMEGVCGVDVQRVSTYSFWLENLWILTKFQIWRIFEFAYSEYDIYPNISKYRQKGLEILRLHCLHLKTSSEELSLTVIQIPAIQTVRIKALWEYGQSS